MPLTTMERRRDRFDEQLTHLVDDLMALSRALRDGVNRNAVAHELDRVLRDLGARVVA